MSCHSPCGSTNQVVREVVRQELDTSTGDLIKLQESLSDFTNSLVEILTAKYPEHYFNEVIVQLFEDYKPTILEAMRIPEFEENLAEMKTLVAGFGYDLRDLSSLFDFSKIGLEGPLSSDHISINDSENLTKYLSKLNEGYPHVQAMLDGGPYQEGQVIETQGFYSPGDYGNARYVIMPESSVIEDDLRYWTYGELGNHYAFKIPETDLVATLIPQEEFRLEQFGAKGDGVYDCSSAFEAALSYQTHGSGWYRSATRIYLVMGKHYFCTRRINLKKSVKIYSDGSGLASGSPAKVSFAPGVTGFIVNRYNTYDNYVENPPTSAGDSSCLEGFTLQGSRGEADICGGHGIWMRARASVKNMQISGFEGNGIHVYAASNGGPDFLGNANNFDIQTSRIIQNNIGVYVQGYDANAGTIMGVDSSSNRQAGFFDRSFLGNQWISCHAASNGSKVAYVLYDGVYYQAKANADEQSLVDTEPGSEGDKVWIKGIKKTSFAANWTPNQPVGTYRPGGGYLCVGKNNRATFIGCYNEGGQGVITNAASHAIYVGGFLVETSVSGSTWLRGQFGAVTSPSGTFGGFTTNSEGNRIGAIVNLTQNASNSEIMGIQLNGSQNNTWYVKTNSANSIVFSYRNTAGAPLTINSDASSYGRSVSIGKLMQGGGATACSVTVNGSTTAWGVREPISGEYRLGSREYSARVRSTDHLGVICTVAGEAGSTAEFKKFGYVHEKTANVLAKQVEDLEARILLLESQLTDPTE